MASRASPSDVPSTDLLSWLFANGEIDGSREIFVDASDVTQRVTKDQALSLIRRLIAGLRRLGLENGDTVCFHAFNHVLYSIIYLGVIGAGGCFMGCNPSYTSIELEYLYGSAKTRWVIVEANLLDNIMPALMAHRIPASSVLIFDAAEGSTQSAGFKSWTTLLQSGEQDWIRFNDRETSATTRAALLSTSGTTGLPKLAALSHYAHVSAGVAMSHMDKKPYEVSRLIAIPQFHAFAAPLAHTSPIRSGIKTYIMRRFRLGEFARCVERHKITETAVVPPMISSLVGSEIPSTMLQSLRIIRCAGSSLYDSTRDAMYRRLHADAIVSQVWGMTELGWISSFEWPEKDTSGSVGRLLPLMEARIIDEHGMDVASKGAQGELQVRGPSSMIGYLNNPLATAESVDDGWIRTGDKGFIQDQKLYLTGRIKELIKVRGWQVSPAEIEAALLLHPCIVDAAVVGLRQTTKSYDSELPRAYVVLRLGAILTETQVRTFIEKRLAKFKALSGGVSFVACIPRNGSGKILRRLLLQQDPTVLDI